ncbi:hypothetical protein ES705_09441 [subsurface metagenome]
MGAFGIWLRLSNSNTLSGNTISTLNGTSGAVGIRIYDGMFNTISGNIINNLISDTITWGFDLPGFSDHNTIIGNTASFFQATSKLFIYLRADADYNTVVGNTGSGCGGIDDFGIGNLIANNVVS